MLDSIDGGDISTVLLAVLARFGPFGAGVSYIYDL